MWMSIHDPVGVFGLRFVRSGARSHQRRTRNAASIPATSGSSSAQAFASAGLRPNDERTSDLAVKAAEAALADAKVPVSDVDLVLLATATPDLTFPATATIVQAALGMVRGAAFDIQAVCSGFVYALSVADALIKAGQFRTALVIGAETFSRILDWTDRATCVLFGDGAGAVVLRAERGQGTSADRGLLGHKIYSDGRQRDLLYVDGRPIGDQDRRPPAHGRP